MRPVSNFLKSASEQGWLSVVMRPQRVDLVHLRREPGGKPRVLLADSVETGADAAATLGALKKARRLDRYRCTALLTQGKYQLIQTEAVAGPPEEAREIVRWKLKDQVDFPVDAAAVDLLPIPSDGRTPQVFAAFSPESVIAPLVQAFQAAKISLAAIDLPEVSQRNLAALFEEGGRGLATLIFDDDEGLLTFTVDGELLVVRHVEITARELMSADAGRRAMLFERIALEAQRSLDNFDRLYSAISLQRLLVAPIPGVDGFLGHLRENLTVPVVPLDVASVLDLGAVPALLDPLRQFQCLRALGAALRDEPAAARAQINLYHPRFLRQRELLTLANAGIAAAVLYTALAAAAGWAWQDAATRKQAATAAEAQLKTAKEQVDAANRAATVRKPSPQVIAELEQAETLLRRRGEIARLLESGVVGSTGGFSDYMRGFARQASEGLWLTGFTIGAGGNDMEIRGSMLNPAALPDYIRRLGAEKAFRGRSFAALTMNRADPPPAIRPAGQGAAVPPAPTLAPRPVDFVLMPKLAEQKEARQ